MKLEWNTENPKQALLVISRKDFEKKYPEIYARSLIGRFDEPEKFCRLIRYQNVLSGTFVVPERQHPIKEQIVFSFALNGDTLFFIGEKDQVEKLLAKFFEQYDLGYKSPESFLLGFMNFMIREDVYFLENYNIRLEKLEEDLFEGRHCEMNMFIMTTRWDMDILDNYYIQLNAMGETLEEFFDQEQDADLNQIVNLYLARVESLLSIVQNVKDYTSQIWSLKQTQLSDKQNKISTVLTIITTIFLPLTLITGWFGMNFTSMPLIHNSMGYWIIVGLCVLIVFVEVFFIYSKHWLHDD